uniref:Uncharacterized protein n=1 Tax=Panagrolaimus superbus TaxID=310955 RepID=A0A914XS07_9BILA
MAGFLTICQDRLGELPPWLNVTLLRNGPGMFKVGDHSFAHWFDGLAFMQRFSFRNGKMKYSARYLQSEAYEFHKFNERVVIDKQGYIKKLPDPCKIALGPLSTQLLENGIYDNSSINFMTVGDTVWAVSESTKLHQIDPETLETIGKVCFLFYHTVLLLAG